MILEKEIEVERVQLAGEINGFDMQLDMENMQYIMQILSDIYKDPYSIIPQELLSNAWDSHVEAGCPEKPIVCELKKDINGNWVFGARDFGVGIGPDRIHIFGTYGKSTKRNSESQIGGWGIGAKSPMSYTKIFFVDTVYNGIKYNYMVSLNEEGFPRIDLLQSSDIEEGNGTRVWFNLLDNSHAISFYAGIKDKTRYFDNIVYDIDFENLGVNDLNNSKRFEGKNFVYSDATDSYQDVHLLINQVPYEIDWSKLGMSSINVPFALKINEGVYPLPTRENIKYTSKAISVIKEHIQNLADEIVTLVNKSRRNCKDWKILLRQLNGERFLDFDDKIVEVGKLCKLSSIKLSSPVFEPLEGIDLVYINSDTILPIHLDSTILYGGKREVYSDGYYTRKNYVNNYSVYDCNMALDSDFNSRKSKYIRNTYGYVALWKKRNLFLRDYKKILNLKWEDKANWRSKIKKYQDFVDSVWNSLQSYAAIKAPKVKRSSTYTSSLKPKGSVTIYNLRERKLAGDFFSAADSEFVAEFGNEKRLVVYGTKEDYPELDKIWKLCSGKLKVIHLKESDFKYLDSHEYVHFKKFTMTGVFSRAVTAHYGYRLLKKYDDIIKSSYRKNHSTFVSKYFPSMMGVSTELDDYVYKNQGSHFSESQSAFVDECFELADKNTLWDYSIYDKIKELEKQLEALKFLRVFDVSNPEWEKVAYDYLIKANSESKYVLKNLINENNGN